MLASFAAVAGPACCREDLTSAGWGNQLMIPQHPLGGCWGGSNSLLRYQMWKRRVSTNVIQPHLGRVHIVLCLDWWSQGTCAITLPSYFCSFSLWSGVRGFCVWFFFFFFNLFVIINFCLFHKSGKEQKKEEVKCLL